MKAWSILPAVPLLAFAQGGTVEGVVFNRLTKAGAADISVTLAPALDRAPKPRTAQSDSSGAFRFENVTEGDYIVLVLAPEGFLTQRLRPFHVGERGAKVEVPLAPTGSIRGRVFDPEGRPVPRIRVELFRTYDASGHFLTTDNDGRFFEKGIVPGLYKLRARPVLEGSILGSKPENRAPLPATPPEGERWGWAPTYFPNAVDIGSAEDLYIREGGELAGLDIRLRAAPVYRLRGIAEDHEGKPVAGVSVYLLSEIGWGAGEAQVTTGPDGGFEIPSVRSGDWRIEAMVKRDDVRWLGLTSFTMPARDYDRVRVRVTPPFELKAAVEGVPKSDGVYFRAILRPVEWSKSFDAPGAIVDPDGRLRFENVYPGRHRFDAWTRIPGHYLRSIFLGSKDVTGADVDLAPSSPPVRYVLAPNAARASGTVDNGAGAKVVLISTEQEVYVPGQAIAVEVCDERGRFTFDGLRPGSYHAFAFDTSDNMNTGAIRDLVFRRGLARQAEVIRLREGETANLKLRISPWFE